MLSRFSLAAFWNRSCPIRGQDLSYLFHQKEAGPADRSAGPASVLFIRLVFHDIAYLAVENAAENINGMRADILVPLQSGNGL